MSSSSVRQMRQVSNPDREHCEETSPDHESIQKALEKGILVSKIKQRIESEHFKHPDLDWNGIALQKICEEIMNEKKQCTNENNQNQK